MESYAGFNDCSCSNVNFDYFAIKDGRIRIINQLRDQGHHVLRNDAQLKLLQRYFKVQALSSSSFCKTGSLYQDLAKFLGIQLEIEFGPIHNFAMIWKN